MKCHQIVHYKRLTPLHEKHKPSYIPHRGCLPSADKKGAKMEKLNEIWCLVSFPSAEEGQVLF